MPLDGELWLARKSFQRTVSIVRRQDKSDHWKELSFLVFDAPAQSDPFERRLVFIKDTLADKKLPHVLPHEHLQCKNLEHLRTELTRVEGLGGEGLMLRQPGSKYEAGRSATLLKVKTFHDAEACVLEHIPGAGRHKGRLGALLVQLPDGTKFSVGTGFSDHQRENPPPVGSTVTFRYQELTDGGVPRFPSFVRVHTGQQPAAKGLKASVRSREDCAKLVFHLQEFPASRRRTRDPLCQVNLLVSTEQSRLLEIVRGKLDPRAMTDGMDQTMLRNAL